MGYYDNIGFISENCSESFVGAKCFYSNVSLEFCAFFY